VDYITNVPVFSSLVTMANKVSMFVSSVGHRSTTVLMNITWWVEHGLYIMWVFVLGHDSNFTANYVSSSFIHENLITYIYIMASRGKTLVMGQDFSFGNNNLP